MPSSTDVRAAASETRAAALIAIMTCRSVPPRHLIGPGPSQADLARMIEAASTAPDHRGLRPYRFLEIADRTALAEAFVVAEREMNSTATEADLDRARERAGHAPCLLAVITRIDDDNAEVTVPEQIASAGAALGYLLLAAHSLGFGAMAVSGEKARSRSLHLRLGLSRNKSLLCFVGVGTPAKTRGPRKADEMAGPLLTRWTA